MPQYVKDAGIAVNNFNLCERDYFVTAKVESVR